MKKYKKKFDFLLYIFCLEILCFSGGLRFIEYLTACQLIWLLTCFYMFLISSGKILVAISKNKLIILLMSLAVISTLIVNDRADNSFSYFITFPLGMILALPYLEFRTFRAALLKSLSVLLALSLIVYLGNNLHLLPTKEYFFNEPRKVCMFFFSIWGEKELGFLPFYRFCSIYWEPGMCQIVIMFIMILFTDVIRRNVFNYIFLLRKFGLLILSIILTGSTMGYLVLTIYYSCLVIFNPFVFKYKLLIPVFGILGVSIFFLVFSYSSIVQDKIGDDAYDTNKSTVTRLNDNIACLNVAINNPFFGLGVKSKNLEKELSSEGNVTSSNGWLYTAAQIGFFYFFLLLLKIYGNLKKMGLGIPTLLPFILLLMSQSNEAMTYFPYMWIYACTFISYDNNIVKLQSNMKGQLKL